MAIGTVLGDIILGLGVNKGYDFLKGVSASKEARNFKELFVKAFEDSFTLYLDQPNRSQIKAELAKKIQQQITRHPLYPRSLFEALSDIDFDFFKGLQNELEQRQQIAKKLVAAFQIANQHQLHSDVEVLTDCLRYFDAASNKNINPTVGVKMLLQAHKKLMEKLESLPISTHSPIPKKLTHLPFVHLEEVIGREEDLKKLEELMTTSNSSHKIVLTSGMGGIGKTTLAQAYLTKNQDQFQHIAWLTQSDDRPENTFLNNIAFLKALQLDFEGSKLPPEQRLRLVFAAMRKLEQVDQSNLLVIDNATAELQSLTEIPTPPNWKVLVTSRQDIKGYEQLRLGYLSEAAAYQLFLTHCPRELTQENIAIIQNIIRALGYHTLSIELYAKTAQHLQIPLSRLEQKLQNSLQLGYETAIQSPHQQGRTIEQVFPYLIEIFQLGELSEKEEKLLRLWTLLPSFFIPIELVLKLWQLEVEKDDVEWFGYMNAAKKLAQKGWLNVEQQEDSSFLYSMHRVICEVLHQKWVIGEYEEEYLGFVESVGFLLNEGNSNISLRNHLIPFGENFLKYLDKERYTWLLGALGSAYQKIYRLESAFVIYKEQLAVYRKLNEENSQILLPLVATTLNNLGLLYRTKNDFAAAFEVYREALLIRGKLAEDNPQTYLNDVAVSLNNFGMLYVDKKDFSSAFDAYKEALGIYRILAKKNPSAFLPDVAMTLNNLGVLYNDTNDFTNAIQTYQDALKIYRLLAEINPQAFLSDVAMILNNLGILHSDRKEFDTALSIYEEALKIKRELAETNIESLLFDVAITLNNVGLLYAAKNKFDKAILVYKEALIIYRKFAEANPQAFLPDVALTVNNLGVAYSDKQQFIVAFEAYKEALGIYQSLAKTNPQVFLPNVAMVMLNLSFHYKESPQPDKKISIKYANKVISIARQFQHVPSVKQYESSASGILQFWEWEAYVEALKKLEQK